LEITIAEGDASKAPAANESSVGRLCRRSRKSAKKRPKRIEHLIIDRVSEIMLNWVNYSHDKRKTR